tara:strand:+ start:902 stop:1036 length:135 start_codon:yes stop_codon:yes gene_type:complete
MFTPRQLSLDSLAHKLGSVSVLVVLVPFHQIVDPLHRLLLYADD